MINYFLTLTLTLSLKVEVVLWGGGCQRTAWKISFENETVLINFVDGKSLYLLNPTLYVSMPH